MEKLLLHICCGVCAGSVIERLKNSGYDVSGYFYNPNIQPSGEYALRLRAAREAAQKSGIILHEGLYSDKEWFEITAGLENEPESGRRCELCYKMRLEETMRFALANGYEKIATTLTVSPHKSAATVNKIGAEAGGGKFLQEDFKKKDGFKRTLEIAGNLGLYRQHYCGCLYSIPKEPNP